jgi:hypothetical protein
MQEQALPPSDSEAPTNNEDDPFKPPPLAKIKLPQNSICTRQLK